MLLGCQGRLALWMMVPSVVGGGWLCRQLDQGRLAWLHALGVRGGWLCRQLESSGEAGSVG